MDDPIKLLLSIGAVIGTIAFIFISYRKGMLSGLNETLELKNHQLTTFREEINELRSAIADLQRNERALHDKVEFLTTENTSLRELVMLKRIPEALKEELENNKKEVMKVLEDIKGLLGSHRSGDKT